MDHLVVCSFVKYVLDVTNVSGNVLDTEYVAVKWDRPLSCAWFEDGYRQLCVYHSMVGHDLQ